MVIMASALPEHLVTGGGLGGEIPLKLKALKHLYA